MTLERTREREFDSLEGRVFFFGEIECCATRIRSEEELVNECGGRTTE